MNVGLGDLDALERRTPQGLLEWALATFSPAIALASSFGAEDVVLIDMLMRIDRGARIFMLDTGRLHEETYAALEAVRDRYGIDVRVLFPKSDAVEAMVADAGVNLFFRSVADRKRCCAVRKVEPLSRALDGLDAWITGLRRDQATSRARVPKVAIDEEHGGIAKINPLADWSWDDVRTYIRAHRVPYNALHEQGYPSIGCAPCTRPVAAGEDLRAGRWWWEDAAAAKECGLHSRSAAP